MNKRVLTVAVALAAVLGYGLSSIGHAASHIKPGSGAMMKEGGDKGDKGGGKDKMKGAAMSKEGGDKGDKGGGKDKMKGAAMMKDGGDKGVPGGKDKMMGTKMKSGDKGGKGPKDKIIGPNDSPAKKGGLEKGNQMRNNMGR